MAYLTDAEITAANNNALQPINIGNLLPVIGGFVSVNGIKRVHVNHVLETITGSELITIGYGTQRQYYLRLPESESDRQIYANDYFNIINTI